MPEPRHRACGLILLAVLIASASTVSAQTASPVPEPPPEAPLETAARLLGGAALGLAVHESGHLLMDLAVGTTPGIKRVSYAGIPFFAITHDPVSAPKEFAISSAGFWAQHLSSELILARRPNLRHERATVLKGMLAFNVLVSVMYAGAAIAQTGPEERDTRGMAVSVALAEPWMAPVILTPAVFDAVRYFKPQSRTAKWVSRAAKVGGVLLVIKARS